MPTLKTILRADWAPHIRSAAQLLAAACVATYTAGLLTGELVHRWNDQLAALVRGNLKASLTSSPARMITQRQAPAPSPVLSRRDECRRLRARGMTQQQIADAIGVSRSTVRRELVG